jgi:hypothetical protein
MLGINHAPKPFYLFRMGVAGDDYKHAVRGSLSRGSWNKCGYYLEIVKRVPNLIKI